jgi:hypothetical protein
MECVNYQADIRDKEQTSVGVKTVGHIRRSNDERFFAHPRFHHYLNSLSVAECRTRERSDMTTDMNVAHLACRAHRTSI